MAIEKKPVWQLGDWVQYRKVKWKIIAIDHGSGRYDLKRGAVTVNGVPKAKCMWMVSKNLKKAKKDWEPVVGDIVQCPGTKYDKAPNNMRIVSISALGVGRYDLCLQRDIFDRIIFHDVPKAQMVLVERFNPDQGKLIPVEYGTNRIEGELVADFSFGPKYRDGALVVVHGFNNPLARDPALVIRSKWLEDHWTYTVAWDDEERLFPEKLLDTFTPRYKSGDKVECEDHRYKVLGYGLDGRVVLSWKYQPSTLARHEREITRGWSPRRIPNTLWNIGHIDDYDGWTDRKQIKYPFNLPKAENLAKALEEFAARLRDGTILTQELVQTFTRKLEEFQTIDLRITYVERLFRELPEEPEPRVAESEKGLAAGPNKSFDVV